MAAAFALIEFILIMAVALGLKEMNIKASVVFKAGLAKLKNFFKRGQV